MSARFLGMNPEATGTLSDTDHLWNSVRDILLTPLASQVMRGNTAACCRICWMHR